MTEEKNTEDYSDNRVNWNQVGAGAILVVFIFAVYYLAKISLGSNGQTSAASPLPTPVLSQETSFMTPQINTSMTPETQPSLGIIQNTIMLTQDGFSPSTITIQKGDSISWVNKSGKDATVNSDPHPTHTLYPPLNVGRFANGETLTLTFDATGTYGYHNHLDASQKGTILVE